MGAKGSLNVCHEENMTYSPVTGERCTVKVDNIGRIGDFKKLNCCPVDAEDLVEPKINPCHDEDHDYDIPNDEKCDWTFTNPKNKSGKQRCKDGMCGSMIKRCCPKKPKKPKTQCHQKEIDQSQKSNEICGMVLADGIKSKLKGDQKCSKGICGYQIYKCCPDPEKFMKDPSSFSSFQDHVRDVKELKPVKIEPQVPPKNKIEKVTSEENCRVEDIRQLPKDGEDCTFFWDTSVGRMGMKRLRCCGTIREQEIGRGSRGAMPENDTALSDREEDMLEIKYNSKYKQKYKQKYRIGLITPRPPPSKEQEIPQPPKGYYHSGTLEDGTVCQTPKSKMKLDLRCKPHVTN